MSRVNGAGNIWRVQHYPSSLSTAFFALFHTALSPDVCSLPPPPAGMEPRGFAKLMQGPKRFWDIHGKLFIDRYGNNFIEVLQLPFKIVFSPITLAFDIVDLGPRGFGVPRLASDLAFKAIFVCYTNRKAYRNSLFVLHLLTFSFTFCSFRINVGCRCSWDLWYRIWDGEESLMSEVLLKYWLTACPFQISTVSSFSPCLQELSHLQWLGKYVLYHVQRYWNCALSSAELQIEKVIINHSISRFLWLYFATTIIHDFENEMQLVPLRFIISPILA